MSGTTTFHHQFDDNDQLVCWMSEFSCTFEFFKQRYLFDFPSVEIWRNKS